MTFVPSTREEKHAWWRSVGDGPALDRFLALAAEHEVTISATLDLCNRHPGHWRMDMIAEKAKSCRKALQRELDFPRFCGPFGSHGDWGANGNGPMINAMLREAVSWSGMIGGDRA